MTRLQLLEKLTEEIKNANNEIAHKNAERALLEYINDLEITELFDKIDKWCA
jgi:hypothetical protein